MAPDQARADGKPDPTAGKVDADSCARHARKSVVDHGERRGKHRSHKDAGEECDSSGGERLTRTERQERGDRHPDRRY